MFGLNLTLLAIVALAGLSAGSLAYALLFNRVADERKAERRLEVVKRSDTERDLQRVVKDRNAEVARRRKNIAESLKELEAKEKDRDRNIRRPPLKIQIKQAGLGMPVERFYVISVACGLALAFAAFVGGLPGRHQRSEPSARRKDSTSRQVSPPSSLRYSPAGWVTA